MRVARRRFALSTRSIMFPIVYTPEYEVDIGPHVFPTRKYRLVRDRLLQLDVITEQQIVEPTPASDDEVLLVHTNDYVRKIKGGMLSPQEQLVLEVPFSPALRDAMWLCAGGTTQCGRLAVERGRAAHLGGGFHHAFPDHGEGFCLINDVAIAIRTLQGEGTIENAIVIDLDVHHGNGTAAIFHDDPQVFTFSMHQEHNYPYRKPPSDCDVGLPDGIGDHEYLDLLEQHLIEILADAAFDVAFYLAGADPYVEDQLGGLGLSVAGLERRDAAVFRLAAEASVPIVTLPAGGYAINSEDTVEIHTNTIRAGLGAPE